MISTPRFEPGPLRAVSLNDLAALCREVLASRLLPGPGYRLLQTPEGVLATFKPARVTTSPQTAFAVTLTDGEGGSFLARFSPGMVEGLEPKINGLPISAPDENGDTPALTIDPGLFVAHGMGLRALIYFRYTLDPASQAVTMVDPIAASARPDGRQHEWHKLVATLIRTTPEDPVRVFQAAVFDQQFIGAKTPAGAFRPLPLAEP